MSKLTIIGDPHLKLKNIEIVKELFVMIEKLGHNVLITGDLLDTKSIVRSECLNLYIDLIQRSKLQFTILIGNHDLHNLNTNEHSLKPLKLLPNVVIADKPRLLLEGIYGIPYIHDQEKLKDELKKLPKDSILFGHLDVVSFDYGNGYLSESGLQLSDLKKFKKVISGHYHKYQVKDNLTYIGTPFSHSYGESNQTKYIGIFDTNTYKLELVKTPFPQHITMDINCAFKSGIQAYPKDHVRIILNGTAEEIMKWKAQESIPDGVKIIERPTDEFMNGVSIDETADNLVKFSEWATEIKRLDPETTQLGVQILEALK